MNAVHSRENLSRESPLRLVVPTAGCVAAMLSGWFIVAYGNPLTAALIIAAVTAYLVAIINPKAGFYLLVLGTGYIDLIKRLGIVTGTLTFGDVVVSMAVVPILCACICLGTILQHIFHRRSLERWQYVVLVLVSLLMGAVLVQDVSGGAGLLEGLQDFANSGAYFPLILVSGILFPKPEDVKQFLKFCLIVYTPVALYAVWQQIFGLNAFEVNYLQTGYTMTVDLLDDVKVRPFSTLNSPHALTVMSAILALLSFFVQFKGSKRAAWQFPAGILFVAACVASVSRAGWVLLALGLIGWGCFRRGSTTMGFYGFVTALLVLLIVNADPLLDSLESIQQKLPSGGAFSEQTFRIETFSDRLYSFRNMVTNPVFHTWFGNPELHGPNGETVSHDELVHDQLTQILVRFGFVGLTGFVFLLIGALSLTHRCVLAQRNLSARKTAIALLSVLAAILYSGMLFGSHLGVFPINVFFSILGGFLLVCCVRSGETATSPREP
jgi:hypothetical protein